MPHFAPPHPPSTTPKKDEPKLPLDDNDSDESGEDYLYPAGYFAPIRLLTEIKNKILEKV